MLNLSKNTLVIGSGKGGVGKSTVTVNLAVSLAYQGYSVGVLDADLYGPSIPIMTGLRRMSPPVNIDSNGARKINPITKFGIKIISIGFFVEEAQSLVWRGPVLHTALQKMLHEIDWGPLDFLLIDLPPGTGDVPISLSKLVQVDGAIIVCTPQEVAMLDAIKAINSLDQLQIPLLGIVENMAGFTVPETNETYHIFGQGKAAELAQRFNSKLLGSIPLIPAIRQGGDIGHPAAFHQGDNDAGHYFHEITRNLLQ